MHHINNNGEARPCRASAPDKCKFYNGEGDSRHYENPQEAQQASEKILAQKHGEFTKAKRYSFLKEFQEKEEQFNKDFDGYPTRFFSADLGNGLITEAEYIDSPENLEKMAWRVGIKRKEVVARLAKFASSTKDGEMSDEKLIEYGEKLGLSELEEVHDKSILSRFKGVRVWTARNGDGDLLAITSSDVGAKNFRRYSFRYGAEPPFNKGFQYTDMRTIAGSARMLEKTGRNLFTLASEGSRASTNENTSKGMVIISTVHKLQEAQREGANFRAQKKRFSEQKKESATAWMDKKGQDEHHKELAKNSTLAQHFSTIELDNDVDEESFKDFESAYNEVRDRLPQIPGDRAPELRIRKLGRHKANGVYFPHSNTIAIDVNTSGSFIHEYGHYMDIAVKNNASLRKDFAGILAQYNRSIKLPESISSSKVEYYGTPTEVLARAFEVYSYEKLNVRNRLIDDSKFENFDYGPFIENDALKARTFAFFDDLFKS